MIEHITQQECDGTGHEEKNERNNGVFPKLLRHISDPQYGDHEIISKARNAEKHQQLQQNAEPFYPDPAHGRNDHRPPSQKGVEECTFLVRRKDQGQYCHCSIGYQGSRCSVFHQSRDEAGCRDHGAEKSRNGDKSTNCHDKSGQCTHHPT